jgi:hypothetical protein
MKPIVIVGIVLIVLGIVGLVIQGINYTSRETVADVAGVKVFTETHKTIPIPLIAGLGALVAGVVLVVVGAKKQ